MGEKFGASTKTFMFNEVAEKLSSCPNLVITNYRGLSTLDIETLRKELRKSSSGYLVVKNSILKHVLKKLELDDLNQFVKGETGIGLMGDAAEASKALMNFSKANMAFKINGALIEGKIQDADRVKVLATLPPREVLLAMAVGGMKSPITGFVGTLKGLLRSFVYAVSEIKNKKEGGDKQ
jgi:large subunit ribosomal protein L10